MSPGDQHLHSVTAPNVFQPEITVVTCEAMHDSWADVLLFKEKKKSNQCGIILPIDDTWWPNMNKVSDAHPSTCHANRYDINYIFMLFQKISGFFFFSNEIRVLLLSSGSQNIITPIRVVENARI